MTSILSLISPILSLIHPHTLLLHLVSLQVKSITSGYVNGTVEKVETVGTVGETRSAASLLSVNRWKAGDPFCILLNADSNACLFSVDRLHHIFHRFSFVSIVSIVALEMFLCSFFMFIL